MIQTLMTVLKYVLSFVVGLAVILVFASGCVFAINLVNDYADAFVIVFMGVVVGVFAFRIGLSLVELVWD